LLKLQEKLSSKFDNNNKPKFQYTQTEEEEEEEEEDKACAINRSIKEAWAIAAATRNTAASGTPKLKQKQ
jgi:hypothetical protein